MLRSKLTYSILITFFAFLLVVSLWSNLKGLSHNCHQTNDLGIFVEVVNKLAKGDTLNPYIDLRGVKIFNDHGHPILFAAIIPMMISDFHPSSLIIFEWLSYLTLFLLIIYLSPNRSLNSLLLAVFLALFSRGLLTGLQYPIHPSYWASPVWFLLIYFIAQKKFSGVLATLLTLFLFRETFPLAGIGLGAYYALNKRWTKSAAISVISIGALILTVFLRPKLLGGTYVDYGAGTLSELKSNPIALYWKTLFLIDYKSLLKLFLPAIIGAFFIYKTEKDWKAHPITAAILIILPSFMLNILFDKLNIHYGSLFVSPLIGAIILSKLPKKIFLKGHLTRTLLILLIFASIWGSSGTYTKFISWTLFNKHKLCKAIDKRSEQLAELKSIIKTIPIEAKIFATEGIVPSIYKYGRKFSTPAAFGGNHPINDYMILELDGVGNTRPHSPEQIRQMKRQCRQFADEIIMNTKYYFVIKGKIPLYCAQL